MRNAYKLLMFKNKNDSSNSDPILIKHDGIDDYDDIGNVIGDGNGDGSVVTDNPDGLF